MTSRIQLMKKKGLINPPPWLPGAVQYETMMGSVAYGVSTDKSDMDVYGFCIPKKGIIFPHLDGHIPGFGKKIDRFDQYQQHHVEDKEEGKLYDFSVYNIVRYFQLCMENNPNMIDSLYTPRFCVLHSTRIGEMVRENRDLFLHKGSWHKFRGYSYSQLNKVKKRNRNEELIQIKEFEKNNNIPHATSLEDVEEEIKRRNLHIL